MQRRDGPPIIGLAGGIGAGKTAVANILAELGCVVANSDALARQALGEPAIRETIVKWWGRAVLDAEGGLNRSAIAGIVFNDPQQRRRLEQLVHPWVESRRRDLFTRAAPRTPALIIDAPLVFEAGLDAECDAIIFVEAPRDARLARVQAERGWDAAELARREQSQLPLDDKRSRADHVVENNGDLASLRHVVRRVLKTIIESR